MPPDTANGGLPARIGVCIDDGLKGTGMRIFISLPLIAVVAACGGGNTGPADSTQAAQQTGSAHQPRGSSRMGSGVLARCHRTNAADGVLVEPFESHPELKVTAHVDHYASKARGLAAKFRRELDTLADLRRRPGLDQTAVDAHTDDMRIGRMGTFQHQTPT